MFRTLLWKKIEGAHAALKLRTRAIPASQNKTYASMSKHANSDDETKKNRFRTKASPARHNKTYALLSKLANSDDETEKVNNISKRQSKLTG